MAVEVSQNGGNPFGKGGDNLRRRRAVSKAAEGLTLFATLIAVAVLVIVVGMVLGYFLSFILGLMFGLIGFEC